MKGVLTFVAFVFFNIDLLKCFFSVFPGSVLPSLIDRLGDAKDQVRDQDQTLLLKIMEQAVTPQVPAHSQTHKHALLCKVVFLEFRISVRWLN